jgi:hypothetical protein
MDTRSLKTMTLPILPILPKAILSDMAQALCHNDKTPLGVCHGRQCRGIDGKHNASLPEFDFAIFRMIKKFPCPNCDRPTAQRELHAFNGVCKFCRKSFSVSHNGWLKGARYRDPARLEYKEDVAWADGELQQTTNFDFDAVDLALDKTTRNFFRKAHADVRAEAARALELILDWIWSGPHNRLRTPITRFVVFSACLRPDLLNGKTFAEIGKDLGVTKACLSKSAINFQKHFRFKFSRTYSPEAVEACRRAQLRIRKEGVR